MAFNPKRISIASISVTTRPSATQAIPTRQPMVRPSISLPAVAGRFLHGGDELFETDGIDRRNALCLQGHVELPHRPAARTRHEHADIAERIDGIGPLDEDIAGRKLVDDRTGFHRQDLALVKGHRLVPQVRDRGRTKPL